ncbi:MAG: glycosyltransferase family 2 protein [Wenzhouxiangella sp.]
MATMPYFVLSPATVLSLIGLLRGPDRTVPTPSEDWRKARVNVVIPALNEAENIVHCLASVARQTMRPERVWVIDDGSTDGTIEEAEAFGKHVGLPLTVIKRASPIGKTPTIKRQARETDCDVEFILDGDTFLESENYIARTVEELYKGAGVASACGTILPMRGRDRARLMQTPEFTGFIEDNKWADVTDSRGPLRRFAHGLTNMYRECLYYYLQRFVYHGQVVFFGGITNPVGCAVAYRRKFVEDLFDKYEPIFGDDLTNSEDIFIGFALVNEGYRNTQLTDVYARSREPEIQNLRRQTYLWSSSFLQSCYYFDPLLRSPFKAWKRRQKAKAETSGKEGEEIQQKRKIKEAYRQPFGNEYTREYGRPLGWVYFLSAIEKIGFPTALLIMAILHLWEPLLITVAAETLIAITLLGIAAPRRKTRLMLKGLITTPIRYLMLMNDLITITRFTVDLWITRNRKWRK